MASPARLRASRFLLAIGVSVVLVVSAPFIGFVRSWIRTQFPGQFVRIIGAAIAVLAVAAIGSALLRIRERRALRYGAIVAAILGAVWYSAAEATGNPDVDVVQRFHFIEYGLITYLFYRAWRPLDDPAIVVLPILAGLLVGTADEWLQWFIPNRVGEIADVFLNGVAIGCGLLFSVGADPPARFSRRVSPGSLRRIGRLGVLVILALALFFHVVHLGHDVRDQEIGVFKSRYSLEQLERLRVEKQEDWRVHPLPLVLQRVSREDQYMTEGVTHVQERNVRLTANDPAGAWRENQILEKYFAPVLDTPSYVSRTGHRWSPEQRADVASRAGGSAGSYVSAANPYPIYAWPRTWFWAAALALAAAVWWGCARRGSGVDGANGVDSPQREQS
jgi:VanZ family protein